MSDPGGMMGDGDGIGGLLRRCRRQQAQTQGEAAAAIGVSSSAWEAWEQGIHPPGLRSIRALAAWSGLSIHQILAVLDGEPGAGE